MRLEQRIDKIDKVRKSYSEIASSHYLDPEYITMFNNMSNGMGSGRTGIIFRVW